MAQIDETHDPGRRSWVASADGHPDFPVQNLPLGIFTPPDDSGPRAGVAIGDSILDLEALADTGLLSGETARAAQAAAGAALNGLFALGAGPRRALRARLSELLTDGSGAADQLRPLLHEAAPCTLHLPARVGDYTDFYVGIHHATNVGRVFRPDNPLLPNYKYVPIGYHGRTSSLVPSGTALHRPHGQRKAPDEAAPSFGPCRNLDFELELGIWIGPGNALGSPIPVAEAGEHIAGFCLLNDWSARDIQAWEYQPLGPFLAKNFGSTLSPWVITPEALAPFRTAQPPRPASDPAPLPYLADADDQQTGALALDLEVYLTTPLLRESGHAPVRLSQSSTRHMYWTAAQLVAHQTSNGCNLRPGDFLGSGTISAPEPTGLGSLLEMTQGGRAPMRLVTGEERRYLEDGDEVILRAHARRDGFVPIGFGECCGMVLAAR
ncbi:fumarylacetoacetase [Chelatococcus reniformis]|uniref:fumarylacetoacetase n=1 Tax=Chelatococcus reniformis TaxID=1494448 RepID=A0A916XD60_9HYPH|nr:fumarylacetoacetase [Chelatococcus reniformis]GGC64882.1 fumarylacetoacetase [Chelatococcus reniformis]